MKILIVCSYKGAYSENSNPFVRSLAKGLEAEGCSVDCDIDSFWDKYEYYDIIYLQWPEEIYRWNKSKINLDALSDHFDLLKKKAIKTVITCHNLHPHNNDELMTKLYNLVYSKVDAIQHMGIFSYNFLKNNI